MRGEQRKEEFSVLPLNGYEHEGETAIYTTGKGPGLVETEGYSGW